MGAVLANVAVEKPVQSLIRLSTAGSVDDGKSTLIGRLLLDCGSIYEDHITAMEKTSRRLGAQEKLSLALVTDGLRAELEQGITIDVAYRYFSTPKRRFILADTPGHEQYTRNMATGASTADLTIVLVDATKGVLAQTRRHAFIASLMGVPRLLLAINKMDLVGYSEDIYNAIRADFAEFSTKLGIKELRFIPVSALLGDNVVTHGENMPWYHGETLLEYLENVHVASDTNLVDFRFPVQYILRQGTSRAFAGQVASGLIRVGEEVVVLPSMRRSRVRSIVRFNDDTLKSASASQSVALVLEDEIDIGRGDMIVRPHNVPTQRSHFEAMVVWMHENPMDPKREYIIRHTTREAKCYIDEIAYRVDVNTLTRVEAAPLQLNEIGRVKFTASRPLALDSYQRNRATGNFILIDQETLHTVGAGMIIERTPDALRGEIEAGKRMLHAEASLVSTENREAKSGVKAATVWIAGLSGAGKSSIARGVERLLFDGGKNVFRLDGDNLRMGLNSDLGFTREERKENLRRAAEVAKLMNQAGVTVLASFITPFEEDRQMIREIIGEERLMLVYLNTPLEVCEARDPNGLYAKARSGQLRQFTGVSAPFEPPKQADLELNTASMTLAESVERVNAAVLQKIVKR